MKLKFYISFLLLVQLTSCSDEAINFTCADPLGTDTKILNDKQYSCFQESFNGCVWFHLNVSVPILQSVIVVTNNSVASIFDAGEVACLSAVTVKPNSGWVYATTAKLHHGYVIRMEDGTYGRLFIDSWKMSGNLVTEINVTRQYAF